MSRSERVEVRLTPEEASRLDAIAARRGISRSELLRSAALDEPGEVSLELSRERALLKLQAASDAGSLAASEIVARELRLGGVPEPLLPAGPVDLSELRLVR